MKRYLSLWLGVLAFALIPALGQTPDATMGKIHGHVSNPTGEAQGGGEVGLSTDNGATLKFTFPVNASGDYSGDAAPGTYSAVYRAPDTPPGKIVDLAKGVKITAGQDVLQDIDMSRQEFIDKMSPEQKKSLEDMKKANAEAIKANTVINGINADLRTVNQDIRDTEGARAAATQALGATAAKADVDAKVAEIQTAKFTEIQTLMTKDAAAKPDESILWTNLGRADIGLKKYDDGITAYKKAVDLETTAKKPKPEVLGVANAGLGEIYARTGKVPEANAAFDAAAKADPTRAPLHLRNEAIIFFQEKNSAAQIAAADEAIKVDPNQAILYYIKGQGLIQNATFDAKTQKIILPQDCTDAYQKYLELAPTGPYAKEVSDILTQAGQKVSSSYKAGKK